MNLRFMHCIEYKLHLYIFMNVDKNVCVLYSMLCFKVFRVYKETDK